jgi:hypothetical protein
MVAIVTVSRPADRTGAGNVSVDRVLQGNASDNVYPPRSGALPHIMAVAKATAGKSYVIFTSFDRGGPCPSALFAYDPSTQVATFIAQWSGLGPVDQIPLPGRVTVIPATIDLATLRTLLYPTGGVIYPVDTGESFCPGP